MFQSNRGDKVKHFIFDVPVKFEKTAPVFIFGSSGSGKPLLTYLLTKYLKITFDNKFSVLVRDFLEEKNQYALGANESNYQDFLAAKENLEIVNPGTDGEGISFRIKGKKFMRWGVCSTDVISLVPKLHEKLPAAQFIHLVRDGREVAGLLQKNSRKGLFKSAHYWRLYLKKAKQLTRELPESQLISLKYESIIHEPEIIFFRLMKYLGVEDAGNQIMRFISNNIHREIPREKENDWKKLTKKKDHFIIEKLVGDLLQEYGYPLNYNINVKENFNFQSYSAGVN